ncbi:MAG: choice-of-anchor J domain-containing protein [Ginsengibacter sp.]
MKNKNTLLFISILVVFVAVFIFSCTKDTLKTNTPIAPVVDSNFSFVEDFNDVSALPAKGWVFKNNSDPAGPSGWRQGRYESGLKLGLDTVGFPAYNATRSPTDYISVDVAAVSLTGSLSAWLISPQVPVKNGDEITFYTRAMNDAGFFYPAVDRMQVLGNFTDGSADCGNTPFSVGKFTTTLTDINAVSNENVLDGYPETWTQITITIAGLPAPVEKARFAFRYIEDLSGLNQGYSSLIGIDNLSFIHN